MPKTAVGTVGFLARLYDGGGAADLRGGARAAVGRGAPATAESRSRSSETVRGLPRGPGTGVGPSLSGSLTWGYLCRTSSWAKIGPEACMFIPQ